MDMDTHPLRHSASSEAYDALAAFLAEMETLDRMESPDCIGASTTHKSSCSKSVQTAPTRAVAARAATSVAATATATATATVAPVAATGKKRIRAKQEIDMLRGDVEALQQQLAALQAASGQQQQQQQQSPSHCSNGSSDAAPTKKSKLRRLSFPALEQNKHLRKLVETQQKLSKQISAVLGKMQKTELRTHSVLLSDAAEQNAPLSRADLVVFYDALTGKLDTLYAQLDEAFADTDLRTLEQQFTDTKFVMDDKGFGTLQMRDVKVLPFDFESVKHTMWQFVKSESVSSEHASNEFLPNDDDDVVLLRRGMTVLIDGDVGEVQVPMRAVAKRFLTKDRMVFCWEGTTDWPQALASVDGGASVPMRERGWAMIKAVPSTQYSVVQVCVLMTPGTSDEQLLTLVPRDEIEAAVHKIVIPTYEQAFQLRHQVLENLLLDEQLATG